MTDFRAKADEFFYNNYTRTWIGTTLNQMLPSYCREMNVLLLDLEQRHSYARVPKQEDTLPLRLTLEVERQRQLSTRCKSPYRIVLKKETVCFLRKEREVFCCTHGQLLEIISYYIGQLRERFQVDTEAWEEKLNGIKASEDERRRKPAEDMLCSGDCSGKEPEINLAGAKSLHLRRGDVTSLRQLNCQDTLRSLEIDQMPQIEELELLSRYTGLKTLYLRDMGIRDVGVLSTLTELRELGLPGNRIQDLSPLASLKQLNHFYAADNPVTDFSVVEELPNLRDLYVDEQQMPDQRAWDKIPERIRLHVLHVVPAGDGTYSASTVYERYPPEKPSPFQLTQRPGQLEIKDR